MKTREFRERLLVALTIVARRKNLTDFLDPAKVSDEFGLARLPGQLRVAVDDLETRNLVKADRTMGGGDEGGMSLRLTGYGLEEAEDFLDEKPEYGSPVSDDLVPASNRYVTLSDNQRDDLSVDLESLAAAIRSSNESSEDDRIIALSEIAAFEATISQNRIANDLIERFVSLIIKWIKERFGEALLGAVAASLIQKLLPFLQ